MIHAVPAPLPPIEVPPMIRDIHLKQDFSGALDLGDCSIGVADRTLMLQFSTYSVISPEGCASILWKSADRARDAAEALGLTAERLKSHGLVDQIVPEPLGGAHRDSKDMAERLKHTLLDELQSLQRLDTDVLLTQRYEKLRLMGAYEAA